MGPGVPTHEGAIVEGTEARSLPSLDIMCTELEVRKLLGLVFPSTMRWCCRWLAKRESDRVLGCWR